MRSWLLRKERQDTVRAVRPHEDILAKRNREVRFDPHMWWNQPRNNDESGKEQEREMRVLNHPILGPFPSTDPVEITVDEKAIRAFEGETIAAAMMANGIRVFRRTEHGGPRGIFCAVGRCSDCLMVVDGVPNVRVCVTAVRKGMRVESQTGKGKVISHDDTL